jgi:hypothetical protein
MRWWRLLLPAAVAVIALSASPGGEAAAAQASGLIVEGSSVAGVALGTPIAKVRRAWGLTCAGRLIPGQAQGSCTGVRRAAGTVFLAQVGYDQLGRVVAVTASDPGWKTSRGIGPGSPLRQLRRVYGSRLRSRVTRVWSYFEVDRRIGPTLYRTSFVGRTRYADVYNVTVHRVHEITLRASRPSAGGLVVAVHGAWPLTDLPLEIRPPWNRFRESLGTVRTDRRGRGELNDPSGGALDRALAGRPAGTASPVRVQVWAGWDTSSLVRSRRPIMTSTAIPLPPAPGLSVSPGPVGADGAATATVTGAEAGAAYALVARWTCTGGAPGTRELFAQFDPAGPGTLRAGVELRSVAFERFDPACAGPAPGPTLGIALELRRLSAGGQGYEIAATADVTLSSPS